MANNLKAPAGATKNRKRIGRGQASGRGTTAGRGNNGQNSRSGGGVRLGFEGGQMPLFRRIARRGFSNARHKTVFQIVNLLQIEKFFEDGQEVTINSLIEKNVLKNSKNPVKILGNGEITKKVKVFADKISASAREKIEKAGGEVKEVNINEENND